MEVSLDQTIDYKQSVKRDSDYKFTKIIQNTGSETVVISNSGQVSTFDLPTVGFNLAKSYINFSQTSVTQGADNMSNLFRHTPPWQRLELFTRSGTHLMDCTNFAQAFLAMGQRNKSVEEYHSTNQDILIKTSINDLATKKLNTSVANTAQTIQWRIGGKELYNTVMSLDKTVILGEAVILRITWRSAIEQGYHTNSNNATVIALTGNITIDNLGLYLAQETNGSVLADLNQVVSTRGMSMLIPYTHVYKTNIPAATSHAISLRFSRGHGISLERVYSLFLTGDEEKSTQFDASLTAGQFTSFYTLLDSKRVQDFDVNVASTDYSWTRQEEQAGRVVGLQPTNDTTQFAWTDNWCGDDDQCAVRQHVGGLDLSRERKYDLYVQCNGASTVNYYSVAVCQKQLMVSPSGVQVM